ncbi:MAG: TIGR00268 family protein, partial [Pseudomonadota bacterium]
LRGLGFEQFRVRYHNEVARIEVAPHELPRFYDRTTRHKVVNRFKEFGFTYITLDLEGYRRGSMNEGLIGDE